VKNGIAKTEELLTTNMRLSDGFRGMTLARREEKYYGGVMLNDYHFVLLFLRAI
jgi:hypothetical protein